MEVFDCTKAKTCVNRDKLCSGCMSMSSPFDTTPYYEERRVQVRFKIFFGSEDDLHSADRRLNTWLDKHPNVRILSYQYRHANMGDHSICITYEEI
jgi:hypothetical protein